MTTTIDGTSGSSIAGDATITGNLVVTGSVTAASGTGNYALNSYVAPATWTKPAGLKAVKVTVVGAGGNGGGCAATPGAQYVSAGGGGAGGAAIDYIPAPSIPGPVAVTAGAGTNSFGAFCSATAGSTAVSTSIPIQYTDGASGGSGSGGQVNIVGGGGNPSAIGPNWQSGQGGGSLLGAGGRAVSALNTPGVFNGIAGTGYGSGGGGAGKFNVTAAASAGAGAPGIVIVEEFY